MNGNRFERLGQLQWVQGVAVVLSLLLSWLVFQRHALINADGVLYLRSAQFLLEGDWTRSFEIYNWPLYSALIAVVQGLTGLGLERSGLAVNALFDATTAALFVALTARLGLKGNALWWSVAVILALPFLNDQRAELIRGHGYWALFLATVLCYLRYRERPDWGRAASWAAAVCGAMLFRIEGLLLLATLPLLLLTDGDETWRRRLSLAARLYLLPVLALMVAVLLFTLWGDGNSAALGRLLDPWQVSGEVYRAVTHIFPHKSALFAEILPVYSAEFASAGLLLLLGWILLFHLVEGLSPLFLGLWLLGWRQRPFRDLQRPVRMLLFYLIALQILILGVALIARFYLSTRFVMPLVLVLLLLLPMALAHTAITRSRLRPWLLGLLVLALADGVISGGDQRRIYVLQAAEWLNARAHAGDLVVTNFERLDYYANRQRPPTSWIPFHPLRPEVGKREVPPQPAYLAVYRSGDEIPAGFHPLIARAEMLHSYGDPRGRRIELYRSYGARK